ncbi:MAG TPA: zinc-ribbon domain-containing protein, partial [Anaerolineae bacterium]|nr:zinc-ribbon domain-containing protein [Anaerolineae bacterium]
MVHRGKGSARLMAQICPKCNTENQDGALHCRRCGAALTPTAAPGRCPQCGADLLPDS